MFRTALSLGLVLFTGTLLSACSEPQSVITPPRPALVMQPQPAATQVQSYPGEVRARVEPELAFRIGGKVSRRLVDAGDRVQRNQPLAELDPEDARLQLEAARSQVAAAEANLNLAQTERERYRTLLERQMISSSQYDTADNTYRSAAARLKQARAEFNVAENHATYSVLRAPQDGVIARRALEVGQVVAAGQTVLVLAADGQRDVLFSLPESHLGQLAVGQAVEVELWSRPQQRFPGILHELSPAADPQSRTFAARVSFQPEGAPVEVGQSARVFIANAEQVPLAVPLAAVSAEAGQSFVWVVEPTTQTLQRRQVQVGSYQQNQASIVSGLEPDDWIVAAGVHMLLEGQQVLPVDRDNRSVELGGE
ncbi:MAG: efflux RND transporter periplasmic adaptor subunit [Gammaproteobacteria bacterium]|nr:efflux RND transporter periplasmic adaptor subunit [Gammaproteobacteria bacterium]